MSMKRLALLVCAALLPLGAALAAAEPFQQGDLRIVFDAGFVPHALPRDRLAPIDVQLSGTVGTSDGSRPPQLRHISIALNRYGRIDTRGLPTCAADDVESTSSATALSRCRDALVGHGEFGAAVAFPGGSQLPVKGKILIFNSKVGGRPAFLAHVAARNPIEATVVLVFHISHPRSGKFGTVVTAKIPRIAADLGYVTEISLSIGRRYQVGGQRLSLLSARCAAPDGFPGALFSLARGSFVFADGRHLGGAVIRHCAVR